MSDDESYTNSVEVNSICTIEQYHMLNSSNNLLPITFALPATDFIRRYYYK